MSIRLFIQIYDGWLQLKPVGTLAPYLLLQSTHWVDLSSLTSDLARPLVMSQVARW